MFGTRTRTNTIPYGTEATRSRRKSLGTLGLESGTHFFCWPLSYPFGFSAFFFAFSFDFFM